MCQTHTGLWADRKINKPTIESRWIVQTETDCVRNYYHLGSVIQNLYIIYCIDKNQSPIKFTMIHYMPGLRDQISQYILKTYHEIMDDASLTPSFSTSLPADMKYAQQTKHKN